MKRTVSILICAVLFIFSASSVLYAKAESIGEIPHCYGKAFIGWSDTVHGDIIFGNPDDADDYLSENDGAVLYERWLTPLLASDEIYSFSNSSYYFDVDKQDDIDAKYYMNEADSALFSKNLYRTFFISPVSVLGNIVFSTYPEWDFKGSCYGMSLTAALCHYGQLDMLKYTEQAQSLYDVEPTKDVISTINYYQYSLMVDFLCENVTLKDSPQTMKKQLKNIVDEVESGKIVLFTYYDDNLLISSGHTVLLTGCYTDENNNHVLIVYDNRYPADYQYKFGTRITIGSDYDFIRFVSRGTKEEPVTSFHWTADFTAFDAIAKDESASSISWYKAFAKQMLNTVKRILSK